MISFITRPLFLHPFQLLCDIFFPSSTERQLEDEETGQIGEVDTPIVSTEQQHDQSSPRECTESQGPQYCDNPYANLPVIGIGMTGRIHQIDKDRVVKVARVYSLEHLSEPDRGDTEYINEINRETIRHEICVYERLGSHRGIISCLGVSEHGIELAFANQGNLGSYIENNPEPTESFKAAWILTLTDTLSYVHSRKVFVDEIALRNFLVAEGQLKLADFGQSILLPLTADVNTISENDLTAKIEILHLGWVICSIAQWRVHNYYFFDTEKPQENPSMGDLFCRDIVQKCWNGEYVSMDALNKEAHILLGEMTLGGPV
ncbi:hypothetical protein DTO166G4_1515 [Paecilomyces variotii]|nr:hypothetical protein DTO166G4_1515 [Paecilomyces variotii]KAJ9226125.1 hypothetical protein DTO169C6_1338 [Paecilomyces variotii]KAJ9242605.1 hypothetical protein DTO166G5_360 [Paecilomyces variotii]KAJ9266595.1 hypothetical protein DTO195F2_1118 [Paecilomyces variotii]KAJ9329169.1 hypothetical protein DTO027B3_569 [Paecilomyces variotii]